VRVNTAQEQSKKTSEDAGGHGPILELAVATMATAFMGSSNTAISQLVQQLRLSRVAKPLHGDTRSGATRLALSNVTMLDELACTLTSGCDLYGAYCGEMPKRGASSMELLNGGVRGGGGAGLEPHELDSATRFLPPEELPAWLQRRVRLGLETGVGAMLGGEAELQTVMMGGDALDGAASAKSWGEEEEELLRELEYRQGEADEEAPKETHVAASAKSWGEEEEEPDDEPGNANTFTEGTIDVEEEGAAEREEEAGHKEAAFSTAADW